MRLIDIRDAAFGWSRQTTLFRVARFEQRALYSGTVRTLFDSLFREVMAVEAEIRETERRLETDWSEPLLKKYESLQSQFDSLGGYQYLVDRDSFIETFYRY